MECSSNSTEEPVFEGASTAKTSEHPPQRVFPAGWAVLLLLFPALLGMFRHEWWRDEAYTWLVVRSSHSASEMIGHLGFNGHPRLYYLLAYALSRISDSPSILAICNLGLALGAIYLLLRSAPLRPYQRLLFAVGFFPLYQYGIIVRCYSLLLFLLFLYADLRVRLPQQVAWRLLVLAVLAQIHFMALAASASLLAFEFGESIRDRRPWSGVTWGSAVVLVASMLLCAWQLMPPPENPAGALFEESAWFHFRAKLPQGFANGFFPNIEILRSAKLDKGREIVGLGLWLTSWIVLLGHRRAIICYATLTIPLAAIHALFYPGYRWHHGLYFIYFILAVWICGEASLRQLWLNRYLALVLSLHASLGLLALSQDILHPYSNGQAVAATIREKHFEDMPLIGLSIARLVSGKAGMAWEIDRLQPVLLSLPNKRVFDPVSDTFEPFWKHYSEPWPLGPQDETTVVRELELLSWRRHSDVAVVVVKVGGGPFPAVPPPLEKIASFPEPCDRDFGECMELYKFPRVDATRPSH